jgi:hypothetical protein
VLHYSRLPKSLWGEALHFIVWLKNRVITRALDKLTPFEQLYGTKPDLSSVPEWGQPVWVHQDSGSKLDGRAAEARWVGFDGDSTHAHRIYWQGKNRVSVERNVRFTSNSVTIRVPLPSFSNPDTTTTSPPTQLQLTTTPATSYLPTPPVSKAAPPVGEATSTSKPTATDSGEDEMPDKDKVEEQLRTPERTTTALPPSAPKKAAPLHRR